jgi:hypothetical protein
MTKKKNFTSHIVDMSHDHGEYMIHDVTREYLSF